MKARWLVGLMVIAIVVNGQFAYGQRLSVEAAKNAVEQLEGKTVNFSRTNLVEVNGKKFYHLLTLAGDEYRVDAQTGEVVGVVYWSIPLPDTPQERPPSDALPLSKLRSVAQTIAEQRYPQFKTKKMLLHRPYWDGYTFWFQFQEQLANGALTGNLCLIRLLPDGRLYSYQSQKIAIEQEAYQTPKISPQQAVEIARKAAKLLEVTEIKSQRLVYRGGRLTWVLRVFGPSLKGYYSGCVVILDARSGSIVEVAPFRLIGYPMPPRGYTMVASRPKGLLAWRGVLLKREFGPIKHNNLLMIRAEIVKALGGEVLRKGKQFILKGDKTIMPKGYQRNPEILYLPIKDLKTAFPHTIEEIQIDQRRNAMLIIVNPHEMEAIQRRVLLMKLKAETENLKREFDLISTGDR
ncbi:hypothetical protein HRbin17_02475 [bacterium HR17]|jgi:uncharacterized membrane protein YkoI|uniref:Uncharacterized protein n=1 Tax=Candidatus Fervidibacter japonicus TaxID=2035412 RepID=A0A2H5XFI2_9BACT|nr:hypothetical protein HRbin17_02475 [bacterium HR17]